MLKVTSQRLKRSWYFGTHINELNLPSSEPVFEIFNLTDQAVTIVNTDEINVIIEPVADQARLLVLKPDDSEPLSIQNIPLETSIHEAQQMAFEMARIAMRMVMQDWTETS